MNAAGPRVDELRQRVEIRSLQLREMTVLDDLGWKRMEGGQFFEHLLIGTGSRLGLAFDGELQLLEEDDLKLLGGVDVELAPSEAVDFGDQFFEPLVQIDRLPPQLVGIDADAGLFDLSQQRDERSFQLPIQIPKALLAQLHSDQIGQPQREIGVLSRVLGDPVDRHVGHALLFFSGADQVGDRDAGRSEILLNQRVEAVRSGSRVKQVVADHRVDVDALGPHMNVVRVQEHQVELEILIDQPQRRAFEDRLEYFDHSRAVEQHAAKRPERRQIVRHPRLPTEGPANDAIRSRVEARCFQIEAEARLLFELIDEHGQLVGRVDGFPAASDWC